MFSFVVVISFYSISEYVWKSTNIVNKSHFRPKFGYFCQSSNHEHRFAELMTQQKSKVFSQSVTTWWQTNMELCCTRTLEKIRSFDFWTCASNTFSVDRPWWRVTPRRSSCSGRRRWRPAISYRSSTFKAALNERVFVKFFMLASFWLQELLVALE